MSQLKKTLLLRYFGLLKIPMIFFVRPLVVDITDSGSEIKIPLRRRTRNHLKSMYFAALTLGADLAAGLLAMEQIAKSGHRISLVFKDVQADFLKRVDGDAHFICQDGPRIRELISEVIKTGERQHEQVHVQVFSPKKYGDEVLAEISLTLSLKEKNDQ